MSWSFDFTGSASGVSSAVATYCDGVAALTKDAQESAAVLAVRDRVVAVIANMKTDLNGVRAKASGNHAVDGDLILSASAELTVTRCSLAL